MKVRLLPAIGVNREHGFPSNLKKDKYELRVSALGEPLQDEVLILPLFIQVNL